MSTVSYAPVKKAIRGCCLVLTGDGLTQGITAFSQLCAHAEGRALLKVHWSDFSSHLCNNPGLLFALVTANGVGNGRMPFSALSGFDEGKALFHVFFNGLDEPNKKMLLELIHELLKTNIAENDKVRLRELQQHVTQKLNAFRFFTIAQTDNDVSDGIEKKISDVGVQLYI